MEFKSKRKKPKKWERKKYFSLNPTALYFDPKMTDGNFIPFCSRIAVVKFKEPTTKYCQRIFDGENSQKFYYLLNLTSFFKKNHSQSMYCKGNIYTQNCPASFHRKQKMEKKYLQKMARQSENNWQLGTKVFEFLLLQMKVLFYAWIISLKISCK